MTFRVETINGRHLLCGGVLPTSMVQRGQVWAPADGSDYEVVLINGGDWVTYTYKYRVRMVATKQNFDFQCRYCLVLDKPEVPEELKG